MNEILCRQLAIDYCCRPEDVTDRQNHFTEHAFLEGRRRFREPSECVLKIAVINGKLLFCGREAIVSWCRETYADTGSEWFFEAKNMRRLNDRLHADGYQIAMMHPFYLPGTQAAAERAGLTGMEVPADIKDTADTKVTSDTKVTDETKAAAGTEKYGLRWYHGAEIEQFRDDDRFREAFTFLEEAPDVIGVAAVKDGNIAGMAGASADSPAMWQIGINVVPGMRNAGVGRMLVTRLKNEILRQGILPYYGTGFSHIASQKVALGAGFVPAWAELFTSEI